jgi:predicted amidohydrolase
LDEDWNIKCDSTILYAYQKSILTDDEMEYAETYFSGMSKSEIRNLNNYIRVRLIKQKIKAIKAKIMSS